MTVSTGISLLIKLKESNLWTFFITGKEHFVSKEINEHAFMCHVNFEMRLLFSAQHKQWSANITWIKTITFVNNNIFSHHANRVICIPLNCLKFISYLLGGFLFKWNLFLKMFIKTSVEKLVEFPKLNSGFSSSIKYYYVCIKIIINYRSSFQKTP